MGRRKRRKEQRPRPVRRIPSIFLCPRCSHQSLSISLKKKPADEHAVATAVCGECGLCVVFKVPGIYQPVDAYGRLVDIYDELVDLIEELASAGSCYKEEGVEGGSEE